MNLKTVNRIFGYGLFGVGAVKIIYTIFLLSQIATNVNSAFNGGEWNYGFFSLIIEVINLVQVLLMIGSAIMIFVNIKEQPKVIKGYAWGLGSMLVTYIIPSWPWLIIGTLILQCGMLMKAGTEIMSTSDTYKNEFKPKMSNKTIKNTEWYLGKKNEQNEYISEKKQKRMEKLEKEIEEWKKLLDTGEIDEETYNQETSKLIEKERKRSEQDK